MGVDVTAHLLLVPKAVASAVLHGRTCLASWHAVVVSKYVFMALVSVAGTVPAALSRGYTEVAGEVAEHAFVALWHPERAGVMAWVLGHTEVAGPVTVTPELVVVVATVGHRALVGFASVLPTLLDERYVASAGYVFAVPAIWLEVVVAGGIGAAWHTVVTLPQVPVVLRPAGVPWQMMEVQGREAVFTGVSAVLWRTGMVSGDPTAASHAGPGTVFVSQREVVVPGGVVAAPGSVTVTPG